MYMLLDLRQLMEARDCLERTYPVSSFSSGEEDYDVIDAVTLAIDMQKDRDEYRLVGRVATTLELSCCRCVERFATPIEVAFDLRYVSQTRNTGVGDAEVRDDDLTTAFYRDDQIDLGQLMREQFYLALPMKPLCTDGCRGLCPVCGTDLNRGACQCGTAWHDPQLAGLKALLERDTAE